MDRKRFAPATVGQFFGLMTVYALTAYSCAPAHSAGYVGRQASTYNYSSFNYAAEPFVLYRVNDSLAIKAQQQYAIQNHPDWLAFQEFQAFKAGYNAAADPAGSGAGAHDGLIPQSMAPGAAESSEQAEAPAEGAERFAAQMPTLIAKCARCHTGDDAAEHGELGPIRIDGSVDYTSEDNWRKQRAIMIAILSGKMPKGGTLAPEDLGAIFTELYLPPDE